jgi:alpha-ketoglutarate-dependent taurine dioxygenase
MQASNKAHQCCTVVSGTNMFDILPQDLKSVAVRARVQYAPHPYVWMAPAKAMPTGLGIESDGLELDKESLPLWEEGKLQILPITWKNPKTGKLHFQVHPCGAEIIHVAPLPEDFTGDRSKVMYPDGAVITDLKEVRELLYKMQRPAIAPKYVYPHDWKQGDLCLFHNRGVLHTVVGAFKPEEVRSFWQCNLASAEAPIGPSKEDIAVFA